MLFSHRVSIGNLTMQSEMKYELRQTEIYWLHLNQDVQGRTKPLGHPLRSGVQSILCPSVKHKRKSYFNLVILFNHVNQELT